MGVIYALAKGVFTSLFLVAAIALCVNGLQLAKFHSESKTRGGLSSYVGPYQLRQDLTSALQYKDGPVFEDELAKRLALLSPLDELPYEFAMSRADALGDKEALEVFANRALFLQPRSLAARLQLFRSAAERKDYGDFFHQYERLIALRSFDNGLLSDAVVGVFRNAEDYDPLIKYLNELPSNGNELVARLLREPILPEEVSNLIALYPSEQERYLQRIESDYGLDVAFSRWLVLTNVSDLDLEVLPFNGALEARPEAPPFNWSNHYERAELKSDGGLFVSYPGRKLTPILRQTISAHPSVYVLRTEAIGQMPSEGGMLEWRVSCADQPKQIASLPIRLRQANETQFFETEFVVPTENCEFQRLELIGLAGAFPEVSRIEIRNVWLEELTERE
ncbi:MAG: hypothetical protein AAFP81_06205 [Pseudomonadota bacterium]